MASSRELGPLEDLRREVETFVRSLAHPVVTEDDVELFDLSTTQWRLSVGFGKLIFEAWNSVRTISRRLEGLAYRDRARLGVFARKPHARKTTTLEFHALPCETRSRDRTPSRAGFSRQLVAMLGRQYPGWRLEHVSHHSDRKFSFSTWYTRGLARQGQGAWAFLGLDENEPPGAADSVLAFGLIWLDWLRNRASGAVVPGLKLFMPRAAIELTAPRVKRLNQRAVKMELFEWGAGDATPRLVDVGSYREPDARLVIRQQVEMLFERHREKLRRLLQEAYNGVTIVPNSLGNALSIRVAGLEVARVEGDLAPRILFGLEGHVREYSPKREKEFLEFVTSVIERRTAANPNHQDDFYRVQGERWLESILIRDITKVDPELSPQCVYSQVPSFTADSRGVIDILGATRGGVLAVIELKLEEDINLPFQALDYWMRVANLAERGKFREYGYFPDVQLETRLPRLYLVAPAFRFHSTLDVLLRYLDPEIEVLQVGVNQGWREGVRVLFRRGVLERPKGARAPLVP
jgi:hypothetical protein